MAEVSERTYVKARVVGLMGSAGTGLILFLILIFTYMFTPIPPYPEGGGGGGVGMEVNLGYAAEGFGEVQQPDIAIPDFSNQSAVPVSFPENRPEEVLSQDYEETANVEPPKAEKKPVNKPVAQTQAAKKPVEKKPVSVVEKPRTINKTALYKPNAGQATSQGNTQGATDQGSPAGKQSASTYGPGGSGGSGPGSGGGSGGGSGTGTGSGIGDGVGPGISYNLAGRSMIIIQKPDFTIQREGIVVVEITVDRTGKVIKATPGVKGSTIIDNTLYAAAKKAALESKFNLKGDAPDLQVGRITYHFKLQ
jgi:hypothetical protein